MGQLHGPGMQFRGRIGQAIGQAGVDFLAHGFGRKPVTLAYLAMAFVTTPAPFLWTKDPVMLRLVAAVHACFCLGLFAWMPTWPPVLFPTHLRATTMAFAFNMPRFIALLGPLQRDDDLVHLRSWRRSRVFSSRRREARRSQKGSSVLSDQVRGARCRFDHIRSASTAWPQSGARPVLPATDRPKVS